jgi:hypothetical protein
MYLLHHQGENKLGTTLAVILQLLVIANVVPSLLILFALMMAAIHSSETSVSS